jgi:hypothetical protein
VAFNFAVKCGDTYNGAQITVEVTDSEGITKLLDLKDATASMTITKQAEFTPTKVLTTGSGLTILSSEVVIGIDSQIFDLRPGLYDYQIRFILANGVVKSYVGGVITAVR